MTIDTTQFRVFDIPPYLFFAILASFFSIILYLYLMNNLNIRVDLYFKVALFTAPFVIIGAKLLGTVYALYTALRTKEEFGIDTLMGGGIVYYGGLTGFICSFRVFDRLIVKNQDDRIYDVLGVCIPLFHSIARVGCFTAGCCYGIESDSWFSIEYKNIINDVMVTEDRIPVQLIEAIIEFVAFLILFYMLRIKHTSKSLLFMYIISYSSYRFFGEFLRGDWDRDVFFPLSGSQLYSLLLVLITLYYSKRKHRTRERRK